MCVKVLEACTSQQIDGKNTPSLPFRTSLQILLLLFQLISQLPSIHPYVHPSIHSSIHPSIHLSVGMAHCASVLVLLSPLLSPWRLRERVWRHLADLRLLHLAEDQRLIKALLPILETPATAPIQPPPPPPLTATVTPNVLTAVNGQDDGLQGIRNLTGDGQRRKGSTTNALVRKNHIHRQLISSNLTLMKTILPPLLTDTSFTTYAR